MAGVTAHRLLYCLPPLPPDAESHPGLSEQRPSSARSPVSSTSWHKGPARPTALHSGTWEPPLFPSCCLQTTRPSCSLKLCSSEWHLRTLSPASHCRSVHNTPVDTVATRALVGESQPWSLRSPDLRSPGILPCTCRDPSPAGPSPTWSLTTQTLCYLRTLRYSPHHLFPGPLAARVQPAFSPTRFSICWSSVFSDLLSWTTSLRPHDYSG